ARIDCTELDRTITARLSFAGSDDLRRKRVTKNQNTRNQQRQMHCDREQKARSSSRIFINISHSAPTNLRRADFELLALKEARKGLGKSGGIVLTDFYRLF